LKPAQYFTVLILIPIHGSILWPKKRKYRITVWLYIYRVISILKQLTYTVFETSVIPLGKLVVISAVIPCSYTLIRHRQHLDLVSFLFTLIMCVSIPLILLPMSIIMSNTYNFSDRLPKNMLYFVQGLTRAEKTEILARLKSYQVMRCHVGGFYYMERKAKLTLIQSLVQGVVFALLTI